MYVYTYIFRDSFVKRDILYKFLIQTKRSIRKTYIRLTFMLTLFMIFNLNKQIVHIILCMCVLCTSEKFPKELMSTKWQRKLQRFVTIYQNVRVTFYTPWNIFFFFFKITSIYLFRKSMLVFVHYYLFYNYVWNNRSSYTTYKR